MIGITLSGTEYRILRGIGKLRHEQTSNQTVENIQSQKDPIEISIQGVITEYAVAKFLNLNFDLDCDYRAFGADLIGHRGTLIEVKSTETVGGNLNAVKKSVSKPCDVFVLTEIHSTHVAIVGWIQRDRFLVEKNIRQGRLGPYYSVSQSELYPFYEPNDKKALW